MKKMFALLLILVLCIPAVLAMGSSPVEVVLIEMEETAIALPYRSDMTILDIKNTIASRSSHPVDEISLYFGDTLLADDKRIGDYGILSNARLKMLVSAVVEIIPGTGAAARAGVEVVLVDNYTESGREVLPQARTVREAQAYEHGTHDSAMSGVVIPAGAVVDVVERLVGNGRAFYRISIGDVFACYVLGGDLEAY